MNTLPEIKLDVFEGPMELLLHLIEKNKIDIYDIPIATLTQQYLEHVRLLPQMEPEPLSEFCVMAATLIEIKSGMLLPKRRRDKDEEEDPREALVERLVEYRLFKQAGSIFEERAIGGARCVFGRPDEGMIARARAAAGASEELARQLMDGMDTERLFAAFSEALRRREIAAEGAVQGVSIEQDTYTLEDRMEHLLGLLAKYGRMGFFETFSSGASRIEIVVTFVALLELVKQRLAKILQQDSFEDIMMLAAGGLEDGR